VRKLLKQLLADYCRKKYFGKEAQPVQIGVYRPSVLSWSCVRKQYNYYSNFAGKSPEEIPDDIILLLSGGIVFHRLIQSLRQDGKKYWDAVEVACSIEVPTPEGSTLTILGHADAIHGTGIERKVYEFKHVRQIPTKPLFEHILQLNFYLGALQIPHGVLCYVGYLPGGGLDVKEFPHTFSHWHFEHLINRAITLHTLLIHKTPPRCSCKDRIHEVQIL